MNLQDPERGKLAFSLLELFEERENQNPDRKCREAEGLNWGNLSNFFSHLNKLGNLEKAQFPQFQEKVEKQWEKSDLGFLLKNPRS